MIYHVSKSTIMYRFTTNRGFSSILYHKPLYKMTMHHFEYAWFTSVWWIICILRPVEPYAITCSNTWWCHGGWYFRNPIYCVCESGKGSGSPRHLWRTDILEYFSVFFRLCLLVSLSLSLPFSSSKFSPFNEHNHTHTTTKMRYIFCLK